MAGKIQYWNKKRVLLLKKHRNDSWKDILKLFPGKTKNAITSVMSIHDISRNRNTSIEPYRYVWTEDGDRLLVEYSQKSMNEKQYPDCGALRDLFDELIKALEKIGHQGSLSYHAVTSHLRSLMTKRLRALGMKNIKTPLRWGTKSAQYRRFIKSADKEAGPGKRSAESEKKLAEVFVTHSYGDVLVLEADRVAFERPGVSIGFLSSIDYKGPGFRKHLLGNFDFKIFAQRGTHFNILDGGLINKQYLAARIKELLVKVGFRHRVVAEEYVIQEAARELATAIPKIKKPGSEDLVRLYILTSPSRDGLVGQGIAQKLQELRPEDIRYENRDETQNSDRLSVKFVDKVLCIVNGRKARLPSKYYSTAAEREITEVRSLTTKEAPDLWVVATHASAIHKPGSGERDEPYITVPSSFNLEEATTTVAAENQTGIAIVNFEPDGSNYSVEFWSSKDLLAREREFITGTKTGAQDIHRQIIESIKQHGPRYVGQLSDEAGKTRAEVQEALDFLVEPKKSERKTWPGLHYDAHSQSYDFHGDWLQDHLQFPFSAERLANDNLLLFGCLHVGYTTTDYRYVAERFPEIILKHDVNVVCGLGDFIAGMHHGFPHTGDILQMNYNDQEHFAAELIGTVLFRVFENRFSRANAETTAFSDRRSVELIDRSFPLFLYIDGNHDLWQDRDGHKPLVVFRDKLLKLLTDSVLRFLTGRNFITHISTYREIVSLLERKVVGFRDYTAICTLPSGLSMTMTHPHLARAATTSLRAQAAIGFSGTHVTALANFHVATVINEWHADRGQCVAAQAGCMQIFTRFEQRKHKRVDFGPIVLGIYSANGRIIMTRSMYYNKPFLKQEISKTTNPEQLKTALRLIAVA